MKANYVIDVRSDRIAVTVRSKGAEQIERFGKVVVVDVERGYHILRAAPSGDAAT